MFSYGIYETIKNSGGYFWKHVTFYYVMKSYVGHKLAILNAVLLLYCIYCQADVETWDSSMIWCDFERNEQTAVSCAWKEKKYCSYCIILIRIDAILSKII